MKETRNPKGMFKYKSERKRGNVRPKRKWKDGLEEDLKIAGMTLHGKTKGRQRMMLEELVKDRNLWRDVMETSINGTLKG